MDTILILMICSITSSLIALNYRRWWKQEERLSQQLKNDCLRYIDRIEKLTKELTTKK